MLIWAKKPVLVGVRRRVLERGLTCLDNLDHFLALSQRCGKLIENHGGPGNAFLFDSATGCVCNEPDLVISRATPTRMIDPRVSVVMPVRNGGSYARQAIESVLSQSYADLELIVIDDGSDDDTVSIVEQLKIDDQRLILIQQPPSGIVTALNRGIGASRGELIARMDADDIAALNRIECQVAAIDDAPGVAAVGSAAIIINSNGAILRTMSSPCSPQAIADRLATANCMIHPTVLVRKNILEAFGGYRAPFEGCEDYDLWLRIAEKHQLMNLPEALLFYRMHDRQCTWHRQETRIVAELGAQACSRLRLAGQPEPALPEHGGIDYAFLDRAGLSPASIDRALTERTFGAAVEALRLGLTKAAFSAFLSAIKRDLPMTMRLSLTARFIRQLVKAKLRS